VRYWFTMENKLSEAKEIVQDKLIVKAIEFGANALIGVDFDMMSLGNNVLVVSVNGTAVKVEKI